jgi:acetoin utilization deacetylase AcuC-like enzyme
MLVLTDSSTLHHRTTELLGSKLIPALECPERIEVIVAAVQQESSLELKTLCFESSPSADKAVLHDLVRNSHDGDYLDYLSTVHAEWVNRGLIKPDETILPECFPLQRLSRYKEGTERLRSPPKDIFARSGYYMFDMSAGISEGTWNSALASANLAVEAAKYATKNASAGSCSIMALCRPPGHHCTTRLAGGYCYINNAVVAAHALRKFHHENPQEDIQLKIAILDLDFHHGNGTQDYFYKDPSVLYVSIHGMDEYPYYSGAETEIGEGRGKGFNINYPLPSGSGINEYSKVLESALAAIEEFHPDYLIVSLGFDTFHLDPLGSFNIETEDYRRIATQVHSAAGLKRKPSLILLEGGYVLDRLGANLCTFLLGWEDAEHAE